MNNLIDRQMAIDAIRSIIAIARTLDDGLILIDKADAQEALMKLPSAQPERNTGEWREHIFDGIMGRRPRALMRTNCNVISIYASNFCPNCGADMREDPND